jgi:hypothetical protein
MAEAIRSDNNQDRETRMRFMRIDERTGELLREFWNIVEPACRMYSMDFIGTLQRASACRLIGGDIPATAAQRHVARLFNGRFDHEYMEGYGRSA